LEGAVKFLLEIKKIFKKADKLSISTQTCFHLVDQSTQTSNGTSSISVQVSPNLREESTQYIFEAVSDSTQTDLIESNDMSFQGGHLFTQQYSSKRRLEKRVERTILVLTKKYYLITISSSLILFIKNAHLLEIIDMLKLEKIIKQSYQAVWKINYQCSQRYLLVLNLIFIHNYARKKN
jgi:hypothetical protein